MRRPFPLMRRLRAAKGKIVMAAIWAAAALACAIALLIEDRLAPGSGSAVAVVASHDVRAPESGRIATLLVVPHQRVEAGTALATIEVPGLTQQIAAAEAEVQSIEAQLGAEEADRDRKFAKDLDAARAGWLQSLVDLERDRADLVGAEQELARARSPGVLVAAGEIDRLSVTRDALNAAVVAREKENAALERAYESARARAGLDPALLKPALAAAALEAESLRAMAEANVLKATVSGVVAAPLDAQVRKDGGVEPAFPVLGEWVQAGVPVLRLVEPATQDAVVFVQAEQARDLTPGAPVSVRSMGGRRFEATIQAVGAAVEPVPTRQLTDPMIAEWGVPVTLRVMNDVLTPGESLSVEF